MSAAHDAAERVLADDAMHGEHFVLAIDPANERLVRDVWQVLHDRGMTPHGSDARAVIAVIAQSAGGEDRV